jgi:hypothetical protein
LNEITAYREQIDGLVTMLTAQIAEVPDDILYRRSGPPQNPVGFIYWHILRIWDLDHSLCTGTNPLTDDLWHRHDFSTRADYTPDGLGLRGLGMGVGYSDAEVDAVRIPRDVLTEYQSTLVAATNDYLDSADDATIRAERPSPLSPGATMTAAQRLQHTISHSYHHLGEIRFIKGTFGITDPTYPK